MTSHSNKFRGLGGWLTIIGIGLVIAAIRISFELFVSYPDLMSSDAWDALTDSNGELFQPLLEPLIFSRIILNVLFLGAFCYLGYLFLCESKFFPRVFIGTVAAGAAWVPIESMVVHLSDLDPAILGYDSFGPYMRAIAPALIWIPYMLRSKRVKATFVH